MDVNLEKALRKSLTFPIGVQEGWKLSREYQMFGTPVGYLINGSGVVTSEPGLGIQGILDTAARATLDEQLSGRLKELNQQLEVGQSELDIVERRRLYLRETILRISGAIQALTEFRDANSIWQRTTTPEAASSPLTDLADTNGESS